MSYVPWTKIFSYDADVTMVADSRGHGKTFGLREQFLRDFIKHGQTFVQIVRTEAKIVPTSRGYFDALAKPNAKGEMTSKVLRKNPYVFRRSGNDYLAQKVPRDAGATWKPKKKNWERIGYFVSLSKAQDYKMMTFANVRRLCLDEALIEHPSGPNNYLPYEFDSLVSIVDTCTRERADDGKHKPNVYLLTNSCGIVNPYFQHYGINEVPPEGFSWYGGKTFLLWVGNDAAYAEEKRSGTVAGRMSIGTESDAMVNSNQFLNARTGLIEGKTSAADFVCAIKCRGFIYGVWLDISRPMYYITSRVPEKAGPTYALTTEDNDISYIIAMRTTPRIESIIDAYRIGAVRFDKAGTREKFERDVLGMFGFR